MIFIGIIGLLSSLALFICSIEMFCNSEVWLGILLLFVFLYVLTFTVVLWKNDTHVRENQEKIKALYVEIQDLKKHLGLSLEEKKESPFYEEKPWDESNGKWIQDEEGNWKFISDEEGE